MADGSGAKFYTQSEERINILSHVLGLLLSVIALPLLMLHAIRHGNGWHLVAFTVFAVSMIGLYASSTFYHRSKDPAVRTRMRIVDHASIYLLIAGTYTPFTLITLGGTPGWVIFAVSWSLAVTGIVLKIFFTGRFELLSTLMYVFMGWIVIFVIKPLIDNLPLEGVYWLIAGGVAYTVGAVVYSISKIHFNHATFHVFVLIGSFCHFMAVYFYVLPHPK